MGSWGGDLDAFTEGNSVGAVGCGLVVTRRFGGKGSGIKKRARPKKR